MSEQYTRLQPTLGDILKDCLHNQNQEENKPMLTPDMQFPAHFEYQDGCGPSYPAIVTGRYEGKYTAIIREVAYTYSLIFDKEGKRIDTMGDVEPSQCLVAINPLDDRVKKLFRELPTEESVSIRAIVNVNIGRKVSGIRMMRRISNLPLTEAKRMFELIAEGKL